MNFVNILLVVLLGSITAFFMWAVSVAGFGAKVNVAIGATMAITLAALFWNVFRSPITSVLALLLVLDLIVAAGAWAYFVRQSPSVTATSEDRD